MPWKFWLVLEKAFENVALETWVSDTDDGILIYVLGTDCRTFMFALEADCGTFIFAWIMLE